MGLDFSHHDYMNCKINDFIPSIKYLNKLGFLVIRMGKHVEKKIVYKSKLFIDYASSKYRSDFLDLWLKQNCEFAVCSPSGIATPLFIFKKPIIFVNCIPFSNIYDLQNHHFFLPKKIKYKNSSKFISLIKQKKNNFINFKRTENYTKNNLLVFDNTKKEIKNTIVDFLSRKSKRISSKKKKLLNKNFINIANKNSQKKVRANISISFLLHNKWFLKKH